MEEGLGERLLTIYQILTGIAITITAACTPKTASISAATETLTGPDEGVDVD